MQFISSMEVGANECSGSEPIFGLCVLLKDKWVSDYGVYLSSECFKPTVAPFTNMVWL